MIDMGLYEATKNSAGGPMVVPKQPLPHEMPQIVDAEADERSGSLTLHRLALSTIMLSVAAYVWLF